MIQFRYILSAAVLSVSCAIAYGQGLNPTVEVTNAYEGRQKDVDKPLLKMAVPDTVMRFDFDFDYSVLESPYKGSYEFSPYLVDMRPQPREDSSRKLYLRAGAGYALHPDVDVVYSPTLNFPLKFSVYGSHHSYFGKYRSTFLNTDEDGYYWQVTDRNHTHATDASHPKISGYDMENRAGIDLRRDWKRNSLAVDLGYEGIASSLDEVSTKNYNAFVAKARFASHDERNSYFYYDLSANFRYAGDKNTYTTNIIGPGYYYDYASYGADIFVNEYGIRENMADLFIGGTFGPILGPDRRVLMDFGYVLSTYGDFSGGTNMYLCPKYQFETGRWQLSLGARASMLFGYDKSDYLTGPGAFSRKGQYIYPDVHASYEAVLDKLSLFGDVTGGDRINSYYSILSDNHWFSGFYSPGLPLLDNTIERFNASLGLRGQAAGRLHYELKGGFAMYANGLMDATLVNVFAGIPGQFIYIPDDLTYGYWLPVVSYVDYNQFYGSLALAWKSRSVSVDASALWRSTNLGSREEGLFFAPSSLCGNLRAVYNWKERIYAGVSVKAASARKGLSYPAVNYFIYELRLPGYVDLGLSLEYRYNRKLSFWLEGNNLLDMSIQTHPGYSSPGIWGSVGICLSL